MHGEVTNPAINLTPMPLHVIAIIIHVQATEEYPMKKKYLYIWPTLTAEDSETPITKHCDKSQC
jgi:hypothetical protein